MVATGLEAEESVIVPGPLARLHKPEPDDGVLAANVVEAVPPEPVPQRL